MSQLEVRFIYPTTHYLVFDTDTEFPEFTGDRSDSEAWWKWFDNNRDILAEDWNRTWADSDPSDIEIDWVQESR